MAGAHVHSLYRHGSSSLHLAAPQVKVVTAFGLVLAIVVTPREALWAFALFALGIGAGMVVASLPASFVARRMLIEVPFVLVALLLPVLGSGPRVEVLGLPLSEQGLWDMGNIVFKATLGLATAVLLAATTQVPDLLRGLDALRVPRVVTGIMSFMVRYIDVVVGDFSRMRTAMAARGHRTRSLRGWGPHARTIGVMFVRTYERGERVYLAMASRGYAGVMPESMRVTAPRAEWVAAGLILWTAWLVAFLAWVWR